MGGEGRGAVEREGTEEERDSIHIIYVIMHQGRVYVSVGVRVGCEGVRV